MAKQGKPRYVTRAINVELNIEIQVLLWELLDSIAIKRKDTMDYLQLFEIKSDGNNVKIINQQEQPAIKQEIIIEQGVLSIKDITVWIIDESDKQIMLFPSDY
ncbi:DUF960 domain-containing protein [Bacillus ginsengihumi]|uniref:DUF960 domain-containing protein n=1 Tax=Heyndrickxia ginsengihumi TaxID=363870 RepID=A0A6M0P1R7_9BACI|nr:DUF960 family protein [Heyndrickxia ginsengihumi]NEY18574.1 DUF960 domain-containing protein [Heyndrickxia ginsengihumi]